MRDLLLLAIHLLVPLAKFLGPGGVRRVAAESLLLKHQLLISNRSRQRAPNLTTLDRLVLRLTTLFVSPHRIPKLSASLKPATLFKFRQRCRAARACQTFSTRAGCRWSVLADTHRSREGQRLECGSLLRVESILLRSHWVMLVMDGFTRRIIGCGTAPACFDGVSVCRMFNCAAAGRHKLKYLSTDHDPLFRFHVGSPICACWRSRRSSRFRTLRSRIRSSNG